jgi:hypothetical protein
MFITNTSFVFFMCLFIFAYKRGILHIENLKNKKISRKPPKLLFHIFRSQKETLAPLAHLKSLMCT